ncbi:uncharacterized protein LOC119110597 [Pollicipes pollicipes]|uniref:uncharacterized protein LOC119110565 n=1 Tax=Pollicipes pollicipes TaxID=41117 RepID=UPI001884FC08|nr:uncharacterized protein LOC119110565 [Pollicipes pollicipes]XP_037090369.1 uncharacterized protein LOC119110597 [Pollicipes pollicipes]
MPKIRNIEVQCEKASMRVSVDFDRPFYGMIFSKGHYSDGNCVHMQPGSGSLNAQFEIYLNSCGMAASETGSYGQPNPAGSFVENTIIIQYDPLVQEVWDQARKLRCTWYDYYEKKVTFKPFQVDMLNAVTANFLGDNLQCWMQIQVGKGPWASEVSGIVKIGQTMTMVLAIKDDENKFDMLVRNCVAHDGRRAPIQLVDGNGCVARPKVMSKFQKIKNFGSSASVVSYAYFQAFKFPDSMNVHFQCVIQVCRYQCPEPACGGPGPQNYDVNPRVPAGDYQGAGSEKEPVVVDAQNDGVDTNRLGGGGAAALQQGAQNRDGQAVGGQRRPPAGGRPSGPIPQPVSFPLAPGSLRLPRPPRPSSGYSGVNRAGVALAEGQYAISGQPRAINEQELDRMGEEAAAKAEAEAERAGARRRRHAPSHVYKREAQEMTDVETERIIQVVAPGDVAFNLNANKETVVVSESLDARERRHNICMSVPGFVAGLIMLLLVLVIACIVSIFLFSRVRSFSGKTSSFAAGIDNPEFVKCPN